MTGELRTPGADRDTARHLEGSGGARPDVEASGRRPGAVPDGSDAGTRADRHAVSARVRDRQVVLLGGLVVVLVLGLQVASLAVPAFGDALDNPPTVIVLLIVVTGLVMARALLATRRPR